MAAEIQTIKPLALDTQAQIRSSVQISSLSDVVLELVKNSLDADAGRIDIRLNFLKGYCSVVDNGHGITKDEFLPGGGLARLYFTSKDINSQLLYGRYGRFLASLSGVSLLSITSRHISGDSIKSLILRDGRRVITNIDTNNEDLGIFKHGTRVIVHNLFGNLPVRLKYRVERLERQSELVKEFSTLKKSLVGLVLAFSRPFSLTMRETTHQYLHKPYMFSNKVQESSSVLNLDYICSALFQADLLDTAGSKTWRQAFVRSADLSLRAAISLRPVPSKAVQFISLNQYPLPAELSKNLLDQINALFHTSSFGTSEDHTIKEKDEMYEQNHIAKQMTGRKKDVDRWPMFYIRIDFDETMPNLQQSSPDIEKLMRSSNGILHALITEFLVSNGFSIHTPGPAGGKETQSLPRAADAFNNISSFDNWSSAKSGSSTPSDILTGLPFMCQTRSDNLSGTARHSPVTSNYSEASGDAAIEWTNPRTGNTLLLNPCTGTVLPLVPISAASTSVFPVSHRVRQPRKLDDVANVLKHYMMSSDTEKELESVTSVCEALLPGVVEPVGKGYVCNINSGKGYVCTINSGRPDLISGHSPVEVNCNITKTDLKQADVLGQVDAKFILASVVLNHGTALIMIDQHAADERVKVEELFQQLCNNKPVSLSKPINFEVSRHESDLLQQLQAYFAAWEIHYTVSYDQIKVLALPELIIERCRLDPRVLIHLIRREIWQDRKIKQNISHHWLPKISACPQGILDMLISRACRSAIMFNDRLTLQRCQELIQRLCGCSFPFQCAHGRPSLTILAQFRDVAMHKEEDLTFGQGWKAWTRDT